MTSTASPGTIEIRAIGALFGVHAGDSLGATVEFQSADSIRSRYPNGVRDIVGGGPFGWQPGDPTDDTDLTIAIARGYVDCDFDPAQITHAAGMRMVEWYDSGPKDIGGTTSRGLRHFKDTGQPLEIDPNEPSKANGSLMRTMPVAIANLEPDDRGRLYEQAADLSRITHNNPIPVAACQFYCDLAAHLIRGDSPDDAIDSAVLRIQDHSALSAVSWDEHVDFVETIGTARKQRGIDTRTFAEQHGTTGGYVLWALQLAVHALLHHDDPEEAIVQVVATGGDTDTNGAIAGGLIGAHHGLNGLPSRWVEALRGTGPLTSFHVRAITR